jgi:hypothetical protein
MHTSQLRYFPTELTQQKTEIHVIAARGTCTGFQLKPK